MRSFQRIHTGYTCTPSLSTFIEYASYENMRLFSKNCYKLWTSSTWNSVELSDITAQRRKCQCLHWIELVCVYTCLFAHVNYCHCLPRQRKYCKRFSQSQSEITFPGVVKSSSLLRGNFITGYENSIHSWIFFFSLTLPDNM